MSEMAVGRLTHTKLEFTDYLVHTIPIYIVELLAATAGFYYLKKFPDEHPIKVFVWFLWSTVALELVAAYAPIAYFSEYTIFSFLEDSAWRRNYWMYNIYFIVMPLVFVWFFIQYIKSDKAKRLLRYMMLFFLISGLINLMLTDIYFVGNARYSILAGTIIIVAAVFIFFYELLQSDKMLQLKVYMPFYVAVGILVFLFCTTPFHLLSRYVNVDTGNGYFVKVRAIMLVVSNILMYLIFALGFIRCLNKKKSY